MNKNEQILKLLLLMAFADKKYMEEEKEMILKISAQLNIGNDKVDSLINEIDNIKDYFTAKFDDYELGFQMILFEGEKKPRMTMSKYDYKNNKFLDHFACTAKSAYIN